jgi:ABC-type phosphate transport system permease subunit
MSMPVQPALQPKTSALAIASLVVGIISAFFILPFFGGAVAIILGYVAKSEIDGSLGMLKGNNLATAGQVLGAVHIVAFFLVMCCLLAYFVFSGLQSAGRGY